MSILIFGEREHQPHVLLSVVECAPWENFITSAAPVTCGKEFEHRLPPLHTSSCVHTGKLHHHVKNFLSDLQSRNTAALFQGVRDGPKKNGARFAGSHGSVLNVHTEAFGTYTRFFFRVPSRATRRHHRHQTPGTHTTHPHNTPTQHTHTHHAPCTHTPAQDNTHTPQHTHHTHTNDWTRARRATDHDLALDQSLQYLEIRNIRNLMRIYCFSISAGW